MRFAFPALAALVLLPAAAALTACSDSTGVETFLKVDSVQVGAVNGVSSKASGFDVLSGAILTFPERPVFAAAYDLQVRQQGSDFYFYLNPGSGGLRGTGLRKTTRTIDNPGSAPRTVADYERVATKIAAGETYYVQSRVVTAFCSTTSKYAIVNVAAVNADSGFVTLKVISNQQCDDDRLEK